MNRALLAEWTKLRTVRSTVAVATGLIAAMVTGTSLVIANTEGPRCAGRSPDCRTVDTTALTLAGVHFAQLAAIALAALVIGAEFQPRTIRTTLAMDPCRVRVFTAKATVIAVTVLGSGALGVAGAMGAATALFDDKGVNAGHPAAVPRAAGTVLYLVLAALLSVGVATAVRHAGGSMGAVVALLYGPYLLTTVVPLPVHTLHLVQDFAPMTAGLAVQAETAATGTAPLGPWAGLSVLAGYAFAALTLGGILFTVRDA